DRERLRGVPPAAGDRRVGGRRRHRLGIGEAVAGLVPRGRHGGGARRRRGGRGGGGGVRCGVGGAGRAAGAEQQDGGERGQQAAGGGGRGAGHCVVFAQHTDRRLPAFHSAS